MARRLLYRHGSSWRTDGVLNQSLLTVVLESARAAHAEAAPRHLGVARVDDHLPDGPSEHTPAVAGLAVRAAACVSNPTIDRSTIAPPQATDTDSVEGERLERRCCRSPRQRCHLAPPDSDNRQRSEAGRYSVCTSF